MFFTDNKLRFVFNLQKSQLLCVHNSFSLEHIQKHSLVRWSACIVTMNNGIHDPLHWLRISLQSDELSKRQLELSKRQLAEVSRKSQIELMKSINNKVNLQTKPKVSEKFSNGAIPIPRCGRGKFPQIFSRPHRFGASVQKTGYRLSKTEIPCTGAIRNEHVSTSL